MIICSVTCADNLHEAKVMARMAKVQMPYARVVICLVERSMHPAALNVPWFDEVILAKDLGIPDFEYNILKYSLYEAVTSIKPALLHFLFDRHPDELNIVFMDTDVIPYAPFDDLLFALEYHNILLSPHLLEPCEDPWSYLWVGVFNTGFLALRRSEETMHFLEWWEQRLYSYGYYQAPYYCDQKWIDLAPAYFNVTVWDHPGYNVAYWNLHESSRKIISAGEGRYWLEDGLPFVCFHYSGLNRALQYHLEICIPDHANTLYELIRLFQEELWVMGKEEFSQLPWSYDYHIDGTPITAEERNSYRC
ncbi:hypothetical protein SAMN04487895_10510 [Paenibacillus sophorae]|uniref:Nucleotide-diphospho-sugar transferase n=1 Tax=Paenibacillus sophorae TaxID=1333845 RepID=A0A1H8LZZ4_9BACL|nr:hypothetical protein [Paenibacillus sophorae]QWU17617.1 hypothetical protein KP014_11035 [Paenibacillus sophorae]SEO10675.1 hypothetical protein SAMN04487895_10510 [Paenibacillus sophorae]